VSYWVPAGATLDDLTSLAIRAVASFAWAAGSRVNRDSWNQSWTQLHDTVATGDTNDLANAQVGIRDATVDEGSRPPEAGAQVRILPGHTAGGTTSNQRSL
jgi:hypothetical protein